jgi:hypothetical protein
VLQDFHAEDWEGELKQQWGQALDLTAQTMLAGHVDGPHFY